MKESEIKKFRQNRANELDKLYEVLQKELRIDRNDIMPIKIAAKQIKDTVNDKSTTWGYSISNLILPINTTRHIIPVGLKARLKINCSLIGDISKWEQNNEVSSTICNFSVTIYGDLNGNKHSICWHIDCDKASDSNEYHPLYHLHYSDGTEHLGEKNPNFQWGNAIYLDCPRIVHYPLDLILGIGFYCTNFQYKGTFDRLITHPLFGKLYRQSQNAILKPYFLNLAAHWNEELKRIFFCTNSSDLCPILIN